MLSKHLFTPPQLLNIGDQGRTQSLSEAHFFAIAFLASASRDEGLGADEEPTGVFASTLGAVGEEDELP